MPAFVTSELKTAFQIGFLIFIPFVIIDLVVASVLMSMGMMMLSPMLISLPFKIMLFVLVDGWALVMGTLAASFYAMRTPMTPKPSSTIGQHALEVTLMLSAPLLLAALAVGSARRHVPGRDADQRDDAVLHSEAARRWPRRCALAGPWMLKLMVGYTRELIESIPALIG